MLLPNALLHRKPMEVSNMNHDASQRLVSGHVQRTERVLVKFPVGSHC